MIREAAFITVWDDYTRIESSCKVNINTKEVFDVEMVDVSDYGEDFDCCTIELIEIDGEEFDVSHIDLRIDNEYWYKGGYFC